MFIKINYVNKISDIEGEAIYQIINVKDIAYENNLGKYDSETLIKGLTRDDLPDDLIDAIYEEKQRYHSEDIDLEDFDDDQLRDELEERISSPFKKDHTFKRLDRLLPMSRIIEYLIKEGYTIQEPKESIPNV